MASRGQVSRSELGKTECPGMRHSARSDQACNCSEGVGVQVTLWKWVYEDASNSL